MSYSFDRSAPRICAGLALASVMSFSASAFAASAIEEVVVTAQRTEESIQDVPIAVSAFSGEMMEAKQIISPSDLQLATPNVSFTATNFGGSSFSIRGIGRLVIAGSGENGVSIHQNQIAIPTNLPAAEFYDLERVEVLRGPQGTLFGRNATGGAVNMVTKMPDFDSVNGYWDVEAGEYSHRRVKGAINIPLADNFAIRAAGMFLQRDGYIENTAYGQVGECVVPGTTLLEAFSTPEDQAAQNIDPGVVRPCTIAGIDDDIDGRDIETWRITAKWDISDNASAWLQYSKFREDDDKVRYVNQICETSDLPTLGCNADGFGWDSPHNGSTTGGIFGGLNEAVLLGTAAPWNGFPVESTGFRKQHTDMEPSYYYDENLWTGGFTYDFDKFRVGILAGYTEQEYVSRQDYLLDVGNVLFATEANPEGYWPTSAPADDQAGADFTSDTCNVYDGTAGIFGGCIMPVDTTRVFAFDQSDSESEYWTVELKLETDLDGPINGVVGVNYSEYEGFGDYYVNANTLDLVGVYGVPKLGFPLLYPTEYISASNPNGDGNTGDSQAIFGEVYYQFNDDIKFTLGLRYNDDHKEVSDVGILYNTITGFPQFIPGFNDAREATGSPSKEDFRETTGRVGVDWQLNDETMVYAFFTRGYKPGGFNPPQNATLATESVKYIFDSEEIDSYEIGTKNVFLDGTLVVNGAAFVYDYTGLQTTRIRNNNSINDNIDAEIMGAELEVFYQPEWMPGLSIDMGYAYLKAEVDGSTSLDPVNRTAGSDEWVLLKNIDPGSATAVGYIANVAALEAAEVYTGGAGLDTLYANCGGLSYYNDSNGCPAVGTGTDYANGVPAYMSRAQLTTLLAGEDCGDYDCVNDGLNTDLDGNSLPNSPENTFHLGVAYTWQIDQIAGSLTARWDYSWRDEQYAREFNTKGDFIDSWDQHNVSLMYASNDGRWEGRLWVRNLQDEDNITGKYLTADTSGFFRNYFLTEPRLMGASVKYNFGAL